ncbi:hypothetical protein KWH76_22665, partial [Enterobacter roggenkampii]|nr:hypothetical protein [Enterobacter roggenkampii]
DNIVVSRSIDLSVIASDAGNPRIFFEDRNNNIWIVTSTGLLIKPYNKDNIEVVSFSLGTISGITEDTRGTIWISSKTSGVSQILMTGNFQAGKSQIKNFNKEGNNLPSNNIESICADINGKVWLGTKEGSIIAYDLISQQFKDVSQSLKMT